MNCVLDLATLRSRQHIAPDGEPRKGKQNDEAKQQKTDIATFADALSKMSENGHSHLHMNRTAELHNPKTHTVHVISNSTCS